MEMGIGAMILVGTAAAAASAAAAAATAVGACGAVAELGQAIASACPTHRECWMEIVNKCPGCTLTNPRWYTFSGRCASPFPPTIPFDAPGSARFIKTPHTACGAVGVVTYDLLQDDTDRASEKMAVMFSNPYDFNLYSNWYAVGIFDQNKGCNENLYREMYYETNDSFVRGQAGGPVLTYKGKEFTVQATMSDVYQPVMKVEVKKVK